MLDAVYARKEGPAPVNVSEVLPPPYRFRGHASRVNCVAFSRGVWMQPKSEGQQAVPGRKFTLYAQGTAVVARSPTRVASASLDGALSVWKFFYGDGDKAPPSAECMTVLKPRFLDEQASVTDMSWTSDGMGLAVGADDGTLTFVAFSADEIGGLPLMNVKQWARTASLPSPPLRLPKQLEAPAAAEAVHPPPPPVAPVAPVERASPPSTTGHARRRITPTIVSSLPDRV